MLVAQCEYVLLEWAFLEIDYLLESWRTPGALSKAHAKGLVTLHKILRISAACDKWSTVGKVYRRS